MTISTSARSETTDKMHAGATVRSIAQRADGCRLISVEISNGSEGELVEFVLLEELFDELLIATNDDVSEKLPALDFYSQVSAAYFSACSSFAYVQSSLKALYRKLIVKGFSKEASRDAIEIVRERGFVDEEDIALRRADLMIAKLWGRSRILKKLYEEGFPSQVLEYVSESIDGVDFIGNCESAIHKKYPVIPSERRERDKMYAALIRLGYSSSDIKRAILKIQENE